MKYTTSIRFWMLWHAVLLIGLSAVHETCAIEPENVLVLYNDDGGPTGPGFQIASHYQQQRPGVHLAGLSGIDAIRSGSELEQVSGSDYLSVIRPQVLSAIGAISDRIDVIVTTKGLPLRINSGGSDTATLEPWSSFESELTRIDEIDSIGEMRDQVIEIDAGIFKIPQPPKNPYYNRFNINFPFVHTGSDPNFADIRLSSRLDGKTVEDVIAAIDRAQNVYVVPTGHYVVADDDLSAGTDELIDVLGESGFGPGPGLVDPVNLDGVLDLHGQAYVYENTDNATTTAPGPVIGYVSHGTNDGSGGLSGNYIENGELQFSLADGAVFHTFESFNGQTFANPNSQTDGQIADWLEIGGTAGLGHVAEPLNGFMNVSNEDQFYAAILPDAGAQPGESGLTFVEAAWSSILQLSYVNTVVGDPLMRFQAWLPGDVNLDGSVDIFDVFILQANWLQPGGFAQGDMNNDGVVDFFDVLVVQANWLQSVNSAGQTALSGGIEELTLDPLTGLLEGTTVPEPSTIIAMISGVLSLGLLRRGR